MQTPQSLNWPTPDTPFDTSAERAALERLAVAVAASEHAEPIDPEESAADVPPYFKDLADELGGVSVGSEFELNLLAEDRTELGPFTLLGEYESYYPLFETADDAVIVTINDEGVPGGVWWIDEELDMHLLATSFTEYVDLVTAAISRLTPDTESPGEEIWEAVLSTKRSTFSVLDSVEDLGAHVKFASDGLTASLVHD